MNEQLGMMADKQRVLSQARYNLAFSAELYDRATTGKSTVWACALQDDAMALCGSPYHKLSHRQWGNAALDFLARFE